MCEWNADRHVDAIQCDPHRRSADRTVMRGHEPQRRNKDHAQANSDVEADAGPTVCQLQSVEVNLSNHSRRIR